MWQGKRPGATYVARETSHCHAHATTLAIIVYVANETSHCHLLCFFVFRYEWYLFYRAISEKNGFEEI
jgi:hypothetical protein